MFQKYFASVFLFFFLIFLFSKFFIPEPKNGSILYMTGGNWGVLFDREGNGFFGLQKKMKEKYGINVRYAKSTKKLKDVRALIVFDILSKKKKTYSRQPKEKMILFLWEPPTVLPQNDDKTYHEYFSKIYTWNDDWVDGKKYFKLYYPQTDLAVTQERKPFLEKKLCALIAKNKSSSYPEELYSERKKIIEFLEKRVPGEFDLFGEGWEKTHPTYRGKVVGKTCLRNYKFSICYENYRASGYVTEKIFDSFREGCVPVYLGAKNITSYVSEDCFIDRKKFETDEALYQYLKNMSEATYLGYIEKIEKFLQSKQVQKFSSEHLVETVREAVGF